MRFNPPSSCECAAPRKRVPRAALKARLRCSRVPKGATHAQRTRAHSLIVADFVRMKRLLMHEGMKTLTTMLRTYFRKRLNAVVDRVEARMEKSARPFGTKVTVDFEGLGSDEGLWRDAIESVLGHDASVELVNEYVPTVQSIAARAHNRVTLFLGLDEPMNSAAAIYRRAANMASRVTRITETTRTRLVNAIETAREAGQTPREIVQSIRAQIPEIEASRLPTIARTEIGNAIDQGTKQALKESGVVATVMVVGCQAEEPSAPTFDGVCTCNITDVPVERIDELEFHPNHSGALVPQAFVEY